MTPKHLKYLLESDFLHFGRFTPFFLPLTNLELFDKGYGF